MEWQEITVRSTEGLVEAISDIFYDLGAGGVVIEDPKVYTEYIASGEWDYYDIPEELLNREFIIVKGYLPVNEELLTKQEELKHRLAYLGGLFPSDLLEVGFANVKEEDWAHSWKVYYKPNKIGKIVVTPTWEDFEPAPDEIIIELDPGMAFGTGTHPTTVMVVEFIQKYVSKDDVIVDVGTGTGVLAIAAAKLGAKKVHAFDIDPVAVNAAKENVTHNDVQHIVEVKRNDLFKNFDAKVNLIIANIVADVIIKLFPQTEKVLLPNGHIIASGIIKDRLQDVIDAAEKYNLKVVDQKSSGEWVALCLKR